MNVKQKCLVLILMLVTVGIANAQEETINRETIQWGFQATFGFDGISQEANNDYIYTHRRNPLLLGVFAQCKKAELNINAGFSYIGAGLGYRIYKNIAVVAGISTGMHNINIERDGIDYRYSYVEGDVAVTQYHMGVAYNTTFFQRLKLKATAKAGGINSNETLAISHIDNYTHYYNANKRALKTDSYRLSPSVVYGGDIYLELLPKLSKNRMRPLVPFFNLSIMGNTNSNTSRTVTVEEWIPGNVVYKETAAQSNMTYDLVSMQVQVGLKWFLKY